MWVTSSLRRESPIRSEEHTSELQSLRHLVCRLLLEKKKKINEKQLFRNIITRLIFDNNKQEHERVRLLSNHESGIEIKLTTQAADYAIIREDLRRQ